MLFVFVVVVAHVVVVVLFFVCFNLLFVVVVVVVDVFVGFVLLLGFEGDGFPPDCVLLM